MPLKRNNQPDPELSPTSDSDAPESEADLPPPFFNTTFSTHRISPLHIGKEPLDDRRLQILAKRLRDTLVGDVVRGVQVGLSDDATLGRAGVLERVGLRWVRIEDMLGKEPPASRSREGSADLGSRGPGEDRGGEATETGQPPGALSIELNYENSTFSALILPELSSRVSDHPWTAHEWSSHPAIQVPPRPVANAFIHLPLLLVRMPVPLRLVIVDFLSRTFDCRVSPLRLGTKTLVSSWEGWLAESGIINRRALSKDVALTLGFHVGPAESRGANDEAEEPTQLGLKAIEVIIPAEEVSRFVRAGEGQSLAQRKRKAQSTVPGPLSASRRRRLAGGKDEEGWAWRDEELDDGERNDARISQPFLEALEAYVHHHLALNLFHPGVRVLRVACDGFVLSEGKVKVFAPDRGDRGGSATDLGSHAAMWKLVNGLVQKARGRQWS